MNAMDKKFSSSMENLMPQEYNFGDIKLQEDRAENTLFARQGKRKVKRYGCKKSLVAYRVSKSFKECNIFRKIQEL